MRHIVPRRAWLCAVLLACGPTGDGQQPGPGITDFGETGPTYCGSVTRSLRFDERLADVLILFDRSGSMQAAFGEGTRFSAETSTLKEVLRAYDNRIRFGVQQFPRKGGCGPAGAALCCVDGPGVPLGLGHAAPIGAALDGAAPVDGNTPTAQALQEAARYYATLADGIEDRYVLLATDGQPTCDGTGRLARDVVEDGVWTEGPCHDALRAVESLRTLGVQVIVMGVGTDLDVGIDAAPSCLEMLARAGGVMAENDRRPGDVPISFFQATDPQALERTLQKIFGAVVRPSCVLRLQNAPETLDKVAVFFDGREIPRDTTHAQGWDFVPGQPAPTIQVFGEACRRLDRFQVTEIEVRHGCPPCTDLSVCE